jgi:hypothetical protein
MTSGMIDTEFVAGHRSRPTIVKSSLLTYRRRSVRLSCVRASSYTTV